MEFSRKIINRAFVLLCACQLLSAFLAVGDVLLGS